MQEFNGDHLLNIFETLDIEIGSLDPTVFKAWFDTDCQDTKELLNWMCSSLSKENHVSAQEYNEYQGLALVLEGEELANKVGDLDAAYPDLFELESNFFDIGIAKDEIDLYKKQLHQYSDQLKAHRRLANHLSTELSKVTEGELKSATQKETTQEKCLELSQMVDEANDELHDQIIRCANYFSTVPLFIDNIDISCVEDKFYEITSHIRNRTKGECSLLTMGNASNDFSNILANIENRIHCSSMSTLSAKLEVEALRSLLNFIINYDSFGNSFIDSVSLQMSVDSKEQQSSVLYSMVENSISKLAHYFVSRPNLLCAQRELQTCQSKVTSLNNLLRCLNKFCTHSVVSGALYSQEKLDIANTDKFFRAALSYINGDVEKCKFRNDIMPRHIEECEAFNSKPIEKKVKVIQNMGKILQPGKVPNLSNILQDVSLIKKNIATQKDKLLITNAKEFLLATKEIESDIEVLRKFVICGPTNRIVAIPTPLLRSLNEVQTSLEDQCAAVKLALRTSTESKKMLSENNWLNKRRHLWMNFLKNPQKMFTALNQIEEEYKRRMRIQK